MMFRQILLVAAAALPAVALAGGANDIYFTGDGTANGAGEAAADDCDSGIGDNYVALNADQWNSTLSCNRCVEVVCDDDRCSDNAASMTLYVVGKCSSCDDEGLDLSPAVFKKLTGSEPSRYTIKWEFAACPTTGSKSTPYQAGKVVPADESPSTVSILQENAEGVETSTQQQSEGETQEANTKAAAATAANGTSPFIVALVVLAVVCGVALAAVAYTAKKRKTYGNEFGTKSFDTFSSPAQKKAAIAKI